MASKRIHITTYLLLLLGIAVIAFPVYLTVITAFKTPAESANNFFSFPSEFYLGNFKTIVTDNNFFQYTFNSTMITVVALLFVVILVPLVSYAITRNMDKKYYSILFLLFTLGILIPFQVIMLPLVKLMTSMDLLNRTGLTILYITLAHAQGVFLYVGYIRSTLPKEIEESAYIDGCTKLGTYTRIIFPLLKPMTATVIILNALWIWNDFLLPVLMLNKSQSFWTLPLFQYNFKSTYAVEYNLAFTAILLSVIPILVLYIIFQNRIIDGLTSGAVKS